MFVFFLLRFRSFHEVRLECAFHEVKLRILDPRISLAAFWIKCPSKFKSLDRCSARVLSGAGGGEDQVGMSGQSRFGAGSVESTWVSLGSMG